jgi:hypothetical protein
LPLVLLTIILFLLVSPFHSHPLYPPPPITTELSPNHDLQTSQNILGLSNSNLGGLRLNKQALYFSVLDNCRETLGTVVSEESGGVKVKPEGLDVLSCCGVSINKRSGSEGVRRRHSCGAGCGGCVTRNMRGKRGSLSMLALPRHDARHSQSAQQRVGHRRAARKRVGSLAAVATLELLAS